MNLAFRERVAGSTPSSRLHRSARERVSEGPEHTANKCGERDVSRPHSSNHTECQKRTPKQHPECAWSGHGSRRPKRNGTPGSEQARCTSGERSDLGGPRVSRRGGQSAAAYGQPSLPRRDEAADGRHGEGTAVRQNLHRIPLASSFEDARRRLLLDVYADARECARREKERKEQRSPRPSGRDARGADERRRDRAVRCERSCGFRRERDDRGDRDARGDSLDHGSPRVISSSRRLLKMRRRSEGGAFSICVRRSRKRRKTSSWRKCG